MDELHVLIDELIAARMSDLLSTAEVRCEVYCFRNNLYSLAGTEMAFTFKRREV